MDLRRPSELRPRLCDAWDDAGEEVADGEGTERTVDIDRAAGDVSAAEKRAANLHRAESGATIDEAGLIAVAGAIRASRSSMDWICGFMARRQRQGFSLHIASSASRAAVRPL